MVLHGKSEAVILMKAQGLEENIGRRGEIEVKGC